MVRGRLSRRRAWSPEVLRSSGRAEPGLPGAGMAAILAGFVEDVFASLTRSGWQERAAWYLRGLMVELPPLPDTRGLGFNGSDLAGCGAVRSRPG
jgi:hypothetical protein